MGESELEVEENTLTPANQNPWYVLMTLYGEQDGEEIDWELHEKNRKAWNAYHSIQTRDTLRKAAGNSGVSLPLHDQFHRESDSINEQFVIAMTSRSGAVATKNDIPDSNEIPDLRFVELEARLVLQEMVFPKGMIFESAKIVSGVFANKALFGSDVNLKRVAVLGPFRMWNAFFDKATILNGGEFHHELEFRNASFRGDLEAEAIRVWGEAWFTGAVFEKSVQFWRSDFEAGGHFDLCTFNGPTDFQLTNFGGKASFNGCKYLDHSGYRATTFMGDALFATATFEKTVDFGEANFLGSGLPGSSSAVFRGAMFLEPTNFSQATFGKSYPDFNGTLLHEQTSFSASNRFWPEQTVLLPELGKASCAVMRHCVANQGFPEEEHFFFRREMSFAAFSGSWLTRLPYRLFGWISDYGNSILRPTLGLLALWLVPAMAFLVAFAWSDTVGGVAWRIVEPFSLSFASIFKIFGFHGLYFGSNYMAAMPMWIQGISGFQTIMGFTLLFFLGLGLRQRFRLR